MQIFNYPIHTYMCKKKELSLNKSNDNSFLPMHYNDSVSFTSAYQIKDIYQQTYRISSDIRNLPQDAMMVIPRRNDLIILFPELTTVLEKIETKEQYLKNLNNEPCENLSLKKILKKAFTRFDPKFANQKKAAQTWLGVGDDILIPEGIFPGKIIQDLLDIKNPATLSNRKDKGIEILKEILATEEFSDIYTQYLDKISKKKPGIKSPVKTTSHIENKPISAVIQILNARCTDLEKIFPPMLYPDLNLHNVTTLKQYKEKLETPLLSGQTIEGTILEALDKLVSIEPSSSKEKVSTIKRLFGLKGKELVTITDLSKEFNKSASAIRFIKDTTIDKIILVMNGKIDLYENYHIHLMSVRSLIPDLIPKEETNPGIRDAIIDRKDQIYAVFDAMKRKDKINGQKKCDLLCSILGLNPEEKLYTKSKAIEGIDNGEVLMRNAIRLYQKNAGPVRLAIEKIHKKHDVMPAKIRALDYIFPKRRFGSLGEMSSRKQYYEIINNTSYGTFIKERLKKAINDISIEDLNKIKDSLQDKTISEKQLKKEWQDLLIMYFGLSGKIINSLEIQNKLNLANKHYDQLVEQGIIVIKEKVARDPNMISDIKLINQKSKSATTKKTL